jgi:hypothetical protein
MKTHAIYMLSLILSIVGCTSNPVAEQNQATKLMEYKIQVYGPACEKLGFEHDTDSWRECIQKEYEQTIIRRQYQWDYPYWNPYYNRPYYYRR